MFIIIFAYLTFGLLFLTFFTSIFCLKNKVTEGGQKEGGRERDRKRVKWDRRNLPSADLLPQNPWQLGQKETRTWKFSWASRMGSKDPIVWNITCCLSGCTSAKRVKLGGGPGTWTQASELGDTGVPKSMLTMAPNTHPYIVSIFRDASYSIAS